MSTFWPRGRDSRADSENATAAGARAPIWRLTAVARCDRCGAPAYVRVLLPSRLELLFCAHHNRQYSSALANIAVEIQDETIRLACCALCGILAIRFWLRICNDGAKIVDPFHRGEIPSGCPVLSMKPGHVPVMSRPGPRQSRLALLDRRIGRAIAGPRRWTASYDAHRPGTGDDFGPTDRPY